MAGHPGSVETALGAEAIEHPLVFDGVERADQCLAASHDGADACLMVEDFEGLIAPKLLEDAADTGFSGVGGLFVELIPFVGGSCLEAIAADGHQPSATADADVGLRPAGGRDGQDFTLGATVWAEMAGDESGGSFAANGAWRVGGDIAQLEDPEGGEKIARGVEERTRVEAPTTDDFDGSDPTWWGRRRIGFRKPGLHLRQREFGNNFRPFLFVRRKPEHG